MGTGMFDSDYEANVKITNVNNFIKAVSAGLIEIMQGTREAIAAGKPVVLSHGCLRPAQAQAEEADPEPNTVRVDADILESIHHLADALEKARDAIPTTIQCENEDFALKGHILDLTGSIHTLLRCSKK